MSEETLVHELAQKESTVLIGSYRLGVATEDSDIDLCVLADEVPLGLMQQLHTQGRLLDKYSDSLLLLHGSQVKLEDADIFVFRNKTHLKIIDTAMTALDDYPKFVTKVKWVRVRMFRHFLVKYGFLEDVRL